MFWVATRVTGQKLITPVALSRAVMFRNLGEFLGAIGLVLALGQVPLSLVTTVVQSDGSDIRFDLILSVEAINTSCLISRNNRVQAKLPYFPARNYQQLLKLYAIHIFLAT